MVQILAGLFGLSSYPPNGGDQYRPDSQRGPDVWLWTRWAGEPSVAARLPTSFLFLLSCLGVSDALRAKHERG